MTLKAIYNRIVKDYSLDALSFDIHTFVDAPAGSGLGTSSLVAIVGAFPNGYLFLWENMILQTLPKIEREDLAGGKQDQYAATFGGFNFMEFFADDKVIVNPLRIREETLDELSRNIVLYYTETSRNSSDIIQLQQENVKHKNKESLEAMHKLKEQAIMMKEALLRNNLDEIGHILNIGWEFKKTNGKRYNNPVV